MSAHLDKIAAAIQRLGDSISFHLLFVQHRGGYRFALTGEKIGVDEYRLLEARFASTASVTSTAAVDADTRRKNNLRHRSLG
ncbi:MAG: hypothetical protein ACOH2M_19310 [Cypionkella sp.]